MNPKDKHDRASLLQTAKEIAAELRSNREGSGLRLVSEPKLRATATNTRGWSVHLASLAGISVDVWLDRYTGNKERKFSACFWSSEPARVRLLVKELSWRISADHTLTDDDWAGSGDNVAVKRRLTRPDFNSPFMEFYSGERSSFLTIYHWQSSARGKLNRSFVESAVSFFLDVATSFSAATADSSEREVYPRYENRRWVRAHLGRERSTYLSAECKRRDNYACRVCDMKFTDDYGPLGKGFAESHHMRALKFAANKKKTLPDELATVCSNCHRMLHRMEGVPEDLPKLKAIVKKFKGT